MTTEPETVHSQISDPETDPETVDVGDCQAIRSSRHRGLLAVVPVRDELPAGALEVTAEAGGRVLLVGRNTAVGAKGLEGIASEIFTCEFGNFAVGAWARALAPIVADRARVVLCPASPDGRDLAPRLAVALGWHHESGAGRVSSSSATLVRHGGRVERRVPISEPTVVTFNLGARSVLSTDDPLPSITLLAAELVEEPPADGTEVAADAELIAELPADPTTMDLVEARRIVGGGAGLGDATDLVKLTELGRHIGASMGATRVVSDAGWTGHERQIGTTGVQVDPDLYLAFGISGAVQHTMGLGDPDHIVAVNTDASCPMMAMADLAVVSDASGVVAELGHLLAAHQPRNPSELHAAVARARRIEPVETGEGDAATVSPETGEAPS